MRITKIMKRNRQANSFVIMLDSRSRQTGTTIHNPTFNLTKPLSNVNTIRVKYVQFANTLFNIKDGQNVLGLVGLDQGIVPPAFYTPSELVTLINSFGIGISLAYAQSSNSLIWDIGDGFLDVPNSSLRDTLGLQMGQTSYTGTFTTGLFLAAPMNVDFISPQLQTSYYSYSGRERATNTQPVITAPVLSGYGTMCVYQPSTLASLDTGGTQFAQLDFRVCDSLTGDEIPEIGHWSMQIEVFN